MGVYGNGRMGLGGTMSKYNCEYIVNKLTERNLTISFAESCTGGMLAAALTEIPGASKVLRQSYVTYSNEAKSKYTRSKSE